SAEALPMTIENYSTRPSPSEQETEVLKDTLASVEKLLVESLTVVEIVGKRNTIVALTKDCIDILLKSRKADDVSTENPYVFARSYASQLYCLRNECSNAGLSSPENITSTKLRKYIATICQPFDLKEHECDWLAPHLGHDILNPLLLAVDIGKPIRFTGKQLEDINITDLLDLEPDSGDDEDMPIDGVVGKMPQINHEIEEVAEGRRRQPQKTDSDLHYGPNVQDALPDLPEEFKSNMAKKLAELTKEAANSDEIEQRS
ncbi:hypothetical protein ILUMI_05483, partial [Ignelater luminosus]